MSRYRKIEVRTWSDEKFRALSAAPPSGQGLWFFLLTGPHTGPIPGLFRAGRAGMAEELGWNLEGFDKAFAEVSQQGMAKADFKARLVWLPNAIKHNKPESPNVVRSWRAEFDLLPECDLKTEALESLRSFVCGLGSGFAKAFEEVFGKPFTKPSGKTMPNQEQEQEQEQEKEHRAPGERPPPGVAIAPPTDEDAPVHPDEPPEAIGLRELVADGVERQHAKDWLKVRRAKRAPLTPTAWDDIKSEAAKAGITPAEAVRVSATNSWQGFRASWLEKSGNPRAGPTADIAEHNRRASEEAKRLIFGNGA